MCCSSEEPGSVPRADSQLGESQGMLEIRALTLLDTSGLELRQLAFKKTVCLPPFRLKTSSSTRSAVVLSEQNWSGCTSCKVLEILKFSLQTHLVFHVDLFVKHHDPPIGTGHTAINKHVSSHQKPSSGRFAATSRLFPQRPEQSPPYRPRR